MVMRCSRSAFSPSVKQRQVHVRLAPLAAGAGDCLQLVLEDVVRVEQKAADKGALAVVDAAGGGEAEEVGMV